MAFVRSLPSFPTEKYDFFPLQVSRGSTTRIFPVLGVGYPVLRLHLKCNSFHDRRLPMLKAPPLVSLHESVLTCADDESLQSDVLVSNLVAKVFGPIIFEASKLRVMFMGVNKEEHPDALPRVYTLTHCDITAMLTLTISKAVNQAQLQGWYQHFQRDDVVALWRRCQGSMSLHVHCHISGGHWYLDALARLRFHIFKKELPLVLEAFRHGDQALLTKRPELQKAPVWVYFHSHTREFDRVEHWGPLGMAGKLAAKDMMTEDICQESPAQCSRPCDCCFPQWHG